MAGILKFKKGLDIRIAGVSEKVLMRTPMAKDYSIKPTDFHGIVPKLVVKEGDEVLAGDTLFHDKKIPSILFVSPVSGKIAMIERGEQRKILEIVIHPDTEISYKKFQPVDLVKSSREDIVNALLDAGLWPLLKQRPFNMLANPALMPKAIFISAVDTAPLAPDVEFMLKGHESEFQTGIKALSKLTTGLIHIGYNGNFAVPKMLEKLPVVKLHPVVGKHPAGNVGVQIQAIDPINKGDVVWTIHPQDVAIIGRLFLKQIADFTKVINVAGPMVKFPKYFRIISGASLEHLIENNLYDGHLRFISGNPLTGTKVKENGHIGFYDTQLSVLQEGDYHEFLGWASPGFNKYSGSRSFLSSLIPGKRFNIDTNYHGGERAFVLTGQYEDVLPMDIYPMILLKAILAQDIEKMENLGIYEVVEEDLALCEFVCSSKIEVQSILREGMNLLIKELQ